ncbi:glucose-6-phosphate translocase-like [Tropilaelaps mercedesae]|uniref:Glucose-6-phosphate translocase-like n=1 Tax=Tropilaelaps mercedesae TaxID=418985 RepID=A0A1V9XEC9_9ACAR|nr:glucose-6-phosphate translocase-like [Tropilaelaps mercedesae]
MSFQLYIACLGAVLGAALYGNIALFGIIASESAPFHLSGSSHALAALAGNIGAIISGLPFSILATAMGWRAVFLLLEVFCGTASLLLLLLGRLDARIARHLHQD